VPLSLTPLHQQFQALAQATSNGSYNVGDTINITATASESIQSGNTLTVTLDTGDTVLLTAASAGTTLTGTYTVGAGDTSSDLTVSSFAIGTVADTAGNAMTSTTVPSNNNIADNSAIVIDTSAPTLSSSSPADDATAVAVGSNIVLNFSEAVDVESGDIVIYKASDDSVVETIAVTDGQVTGTGTATITINPSSDLASSTQYYVKIAATGFDDPTGNSYAGITDTTSLSFTTADIVAPTISSFSSSTSDGSYNVGDTINITATASESIQSGNTLTVTLDTGDTVLLTAASAGTTLTGTYTVGAGDTSSDLTVSSFAIGTVADTAGNAMTSTTVPSNNNIADSSAIVIDTSAPTISSFSSTTSNGSYNVGDTINITATASESIQSGNTLTVTLDTGDTVLLTAASAGTTLTGTYTVGAGDTSSDLTVSSFAIGTVADTAGNAMTSTTVPSNNNIADNSAIVIDTSAPTLSSSSPADDATAVAVGSNIVLNFSEAVDVESGDIVIYKASDDSVVETIAVTDGQVTGTGTATITINPSSDLASSTQYYVKIAATGFDDPTGNSYAGITDTTSLSFTTADIVAPTISSFSSSTSDGSYNVGDTINITATASESIQSGNTLTVTLDTGDTVLLTAASAGTTLTGTYTVGAGDTSSDLTVSSFAIGTVADTAGNAMTSTTVPSNNNIADSSAIVIDTSAPTISSFSSTTSNGSYNVGDRINITATASESIQSGNTLTVTLDTGDTVLLTAASAGTTLTGTYTVGAGDTSSDLTVSSFAIGTVADTAGNAMTSTTVPSNNNIADNSAIVIDTSAPTISSFSSSTSDGSYNVGDTINITATASESIQSGNTLTVTLDTGDTVLLTAASAGTTLTGTYTVGAGDTSSDLTVSSFAIGTVADTAGNAMTSTTVPSNNNIADNSAIVIDTSAPTLSSSSPADDATAVAVGSNIVLNFSEAVDVESGDIVIYKASDDSVVETIAVTDGQVTGTGTATITINPSSDLASSTQYYVKIAATGFDDPTGNSYAGITDTTSLSFTTAAPSLSINDVSYTETSSASNATFTVTLSEASDQDVTVDYASSDVSTTAGSDYTASSGTVTISAGATSATFTVPILVDTLDESNETATVTLSNASNASISDATGTLTIVDDDPVPTLSIDNVSHTESSSAGNATFTVTLSEVSGKDVTVDYASSDVSTTAGSDYTAISGTVTILAGNTTASINVPILVDTLDESNETATVTLSNPTNATIASEATQIGSDIDGEAANDYSGNSVSLSSDGSIVAIGAWLNDVPDSGHVRIYQNNSGTWSQIGDDIDGEANNDHFGVSVSLSGDGSIVAIGADQNGGNGSLSGHVRIYKYESDSWSQIGSDIDGEAENDRSGQSVSLSSDGSTVAIGAYVNDGNGNTNDNRGHVRIYQNNSGTWSQVGSDIDGEASNDSSGQSVSLSSDGSIVAIGAYQNDGNGSQSGHVRIYKYESDSWSQVGSDIDGEGNYDSSGQSVSLSSDGSIVAIGAYGNDGNGTDSGHVRVYQNNSGNWEQIGSDIDGEAASNYFGYSVSLSSDGSIVAIGAHGNDDNGTNSGHVRIYKYNSGTSNWSQIGSDIDGEAASDESGRSVSLSSDGSTVAIGAWLNDGNGTKSGHVRVFDTGLSANTGTLTIVDDDVTPSLSIDDVSFTESGSAGNATFTVTLSEVSAQDVTVDYASSDVSTTAGSDYTASSGTVTIAAGNTTASINVPILVDTLDESNETATVTLSNASNASISDATGTLTIVDDDADTTASAATLTISTSGFTGATTTSVPSGASGLNAIVEDNLNQAINGTSSADYIEIQDTPSSNAGSISGGNGDDIIYIKGWE
jgi:methionine-rich copper-binding protein CopC